MLPTQKGIYGLCQAVRQFWKKFVDTIKKEPFGFTVSPADPCMLFKENNLGICIIIMYVDDMLIIGKKEQIQEFATMIQKEFSVKIQHNLADYLGCDFHMNKEKTRGWLGQPSIFKSLQIYVILPSFEHLKSGADVLHLFTDGVPPKCVPILLIYLLCLLNRFGDVNTKLVGPKPVL